MEKKKELKITLIGLVALLLLMLYSSYAFFQIQTTNESSETQFTGELGQNGNAQALLTGLKDDLHLNLKLSDMVPSKIGNHYFATVDETKDYATEEQNHVISTATTSGGEDDIKYECTSELTIKLTGSLGEEGAIKEGDGKAYFSGTNALVEPREIDLKELIDSQTEDGYKTVVNYNIIGNGSADIKFDIEIENRATDQNAIAGKELIIDVKNSNLSCSVVEKENKTYMKSLVEQTNETYEINYILSQDIQTAIEKVSFVDYIPTNEELSKKDGYWDLSDTDNGTLNNSVVVWIEKSNAKGYKFDFGSGNFIESGNFTFDEIELYNLFIGSSDKIYAKDLSNMFMDMVNLKTINFDNLDTSETTSMSNMFYNCARLEHLNLSMFNTSKTTDMGGMFANCVSLDSVSLTNFDTSKVTIMDWMFINCKNLTTLDLSNFDISQVTSMEAIFLYCKNLLSLDIRNMIFNNNIDYFDIFGINGQIGDIEDDFRVPKNIHIIIKNSQKSFISEIFNTIFPEGHQIIIETID